MKYIKTALLVFLLLGTSSIVLSGCAGKSYSKGFDEAD